jgi:hypothetical protein
MLITVKEQCVCTFLAGDVFEVDIPNDGRVITSVAFF